MIEYTVTDAPQDEAPPFGEDLCEKCGQRPKALYSGRGPRPRFCDVCKATRSKSSVPGVKGQNQALAAQATQALMQINNFATLGLMVAQLHKTAGQWSEEISTESFKQSLYEALLLDPELCRWICRGGVRSGKIALIIAYSLAAAAVVPVAVAEIREKREAATEAKEKEQEQQEREESKTLNAQPVWAA